MPSVFLNNSVQHFGWELVILALGDLSLVERSAPLSTCSDLRALGSSDAGDRSDLAATRRCDDRTERAVI